MPSIKDHPFVELTVRAYRVRSPDGARSYLNFTVQDCIATVKQDGSVLGELGGQLGGGYQMTLDGGETYAIPVDSMWDAFTKAVAAGEKSE